MIKQNIHKYSVSAMCRVLQLPRSTYYYVSKERPAEDPITARIVDIFHDNRRTYGTRRMKAALQKEGIRVSRRRMARMMREQGLVSIYTVANRKESHCQRFNLCTCGKSVSLYLRADRSIQS